MPWGPSIEPDLYNSIAGSVVTLSDTMSGYCRSRHEVIGWLDTVSAHNSLSPQLHIRQWFLKYISWAVASASLETSYMQILTSDWQNQTLYPGAGGAAEQSVF